MSEKIPETTGELFYYIQGEFKEIKGDIKLIPGLIDEKISTCREHSTNAKQLKLWKWFGIICLLPAAIYYTMMIFN